MLNLGGFDSPSRFYFTLEHYVSEIYFVTLSQASRVAV